MATQTVELELGGKVRQLKYTLWSVGKMGDHLGVELRINKLSEDLMGIPLPISALGELLWAGLVHEDENLTPDDVSRWVDQDNVKEVLDAFFSLFGGQLSETARQSVEQKLGMGTESEKLTNPT